MVVRAANVLVFLSLCLTGLADQGMVFKKVELRTTFGTAEEGDKGKLLVDANQIRFVDNKDREYFAIPADAVTDLSVVLCHHVGAVRRTQKQGLVPAIDFCVFFQLRSRTEPGDVLSSADRVADCPAGESSGNTIPTGSVVGLP